MATPDTTRERVVPPIAGILTQIGEGKPHAEASIALQDVVDAVAAGLGKGEVTIKVIVEQGSKKTTDSLAVSVVVTSKVPKPAPKATTMFVGRTGGLTRVNADQPECAPPLLKVLRGTP